LLFVQQPEFWQHSVPEGARAFCLLLVLLAPAEALIF